MGTIISLSIDGIDVDWSKNSRGADHGSLFQEHNRKRMQSEQINYEYFGTLADPMIHEIEMGFTKKLVDVISRIELLGFNLESICKEYEYSVTESNELDVQTEECGTQISKKCMSFEQFVEIIRTVDISSLDESFDEQCGEKNPASYGIKFINEDLVNMIPFYDKHEDLIYSEQSFVTSILSFLHPYSALRLLAENKENLDKEVKWQYGPLVSAGWAKTSEFRTNARRRETFLIITEGHTDTEIIELAIKTIRPEISDFFRFIDMTDGHPFGGTGPLQKFAKGLAQMDVHNQTLFLFDNDTEGLSAFNKTRELNLPANMRVVMLPNLNEFKEFPTIGPNGSERMDINGKAVAIECYLDLQRPGLPEIIIQWSGFKGDVKQYQGALNKKEAYTRDFLNHSPSELLSSGYDLSKLTEVVDTIYCECVKIAVKQRKNVAFVNLN